MTLLQKWLKMLSRLAIEASILFAIYGNEAGVGEGIKQALASTGLRREDLFITSKVWNDGLSYDETIATYEESLKIRIRLFRPLSNSLAW